MTRINTSSHNQNTHTITNTIGTNSRNSEAFGSKSTQLQAQQLQSKIRFKGQRQSKIDTYFSRKISREFSAKFKKITCAQENPIQKLKKLLTYTSTAKDKNLSKLKYQEKENKLFNYTPPKDKQNTTMIVNKAALNITTENADDKTDTWTLNTTPKRKSANSKSKTGPTY